MSEQYTVDYFIGKFSAIPEDKWCTYEREDISGRRCALGHTGTADTGYVDTAETIAFANLFEGGNLVARQWTIAHINNGDVKDYPQPTPKARILAALHDIKLKQEAAK